MRCECWGDKTEATHNCNERLPPSGKPLPFEAHTYVYGCTTNCAAVGSSGRPHFAISRSISRKWQSPALSME